jgi:hypothetical protein
VETLGPKKRLTTNAICDDLELAPRPHAAQIVGTVSFDSARLYDNTRADAEHCSTFQEQVFVFGIVFEFESASLWLNVFVLFECLLRRHSRLDLWLSARKHQPEHLFCLQLEVFSKGVRNQ